MVYTIGHTPYRHDSNNFIISAFVHPPEIRTDGSVDAANRKVDFSPDSPKKSFRAPNFKASPGHVSTHAGFLPRSILSRHMSHFCMAPLLPYWGTPNGHASPQVLQPMHFSVSTTTIPSSLLFDMASSGHTSIQAGFAQWAQANEKLRFEISGNSPYHTSITFLHRNPCSTSLMDPQANSQAWH